MYIEIQIYIYINIYIYIYIYINLRYSRAIWNELSDNCLYPRWYLGALL